MKTLKTGLFTSALISAALLASPLAMADHHGDREGHHGKRHHGDVCEKMESGDWQEKREAMREKADQRHEDMAERLQLTSEQREIWDEMRDERRERFEDRLEHMKERCENSDGE